MPRIINKKLTGIILYRYNQENVVEFLVSKTNFGYDVLESK